MKKIAICICFVMGLFACTEEDGKKTYDPGNEFIVSSGVRLFYSDENNNDLLDYTQEDFQLPLVLDGSKDYTLPEDVDLYIETYIQYDKATGKYCYHLYVPGFDRRTTTVCYIARSKTDMDTLNVDFTFSKECYGREVCASVKRLSYNNISLISDKAAYEDVPILKNKDKTIVSVK